MVGQLTIALDAMGGDHAPGCVLEGAAALLKTYPDVYFLIYGDAEKIQPWLQKHSRLNRVSTVHHTTESIGPDEKPSQAIRRGRNTSMAQAINAVRSGEAAAAVSAGNTGALMAMSKIMLRTLPGIERPAIGATLPHANGFSVMLDMGANVSCDANNLFEFAVMGHAFAKVLLNKKNPSVALLNVGSEDMKGHEAVRAAAEMLRESESNVDFIGYIEGDQIAKGYADVVVTDGFTGNIALKTTEGTAKLCMGFLKEAIQAGTITSKLGAMLLQSSLKRLKKRLDPRLHNGAMFLGLNGIVVKSHGGTDALGYANAIKVAVELVKARINEQIVQEMVESGHIPPPEDDLLPAAPLLPAQDEVLSL